jgi:hypothetical protein
LRILPACWKLSTSCSRLVDVINFLMNASMLMQVEKIRLAASCHLQTWCKLFHRLASSLWISSFDKSDRTTCSKSVNTSMLMQVEKIRLAANCYLQACCKLFYQLASSLWITSFGKSDFLNLHQHLMCSQTCCNLRKSGLLQVVICRLDAYKLITNRWTCLLCSPVHVFEISFRSNKQNNVKRLLPSK